MWSCHLGEGLRTWAGDDDDHWHPKPTNALADGGTTVRPPQTPNETISSDSSPPSRSRFRIPSLPFSNQSKPLASSHKSGIRPTLFSNHSHSRPWPNEKSKFYSRSHLYTQHRSNKITLYGHNKTRLVRSFFHK